MKMNGVKRAKAHINGAIPTRAELIAAQERALESLKKLTDQEGFELLVSAGIVNRKGKLTRRYGGRARNKPFVW
jgi:hypothetical protein